jgi:hypothetical protein
MTILIETPQAFDDFCMAVAGQTKIPPKKFKKAVAKTLNFDNATDCKAYMAKFLEERDFSNKDIDAISSETFHFNQYLRAPRNSGCPRSKNKEKHAAILKHAPAPSKHMGYALLAMFTRCEVMIKKQLNKEGVVHDTDDHYGRYFHHRELKDRIRRAIQYSENPSTPLGLSLHHPDTRKIDPDDDCAQEPNGCGVCGWTELNYAYQKDINYGEDVLFANLKSKPTVVCGLCHASTHLDHHTTALLLPRLVYLPELKQQQLNALMHFAATMARYVFIDGYPSELKQAIFDELSVFFDFVRERTLASKATLKFSNSWILSQLAKKNALSLTETCAPLRAIHLGAFFQVTEQCYV